MGPAGYKDERVDGVRVVGWWGKDALVLTVDAGDGIRILGRLSSGRGFVCSMYGIQVISREIAPNVINGPSYGQIVKWFYLWELKRGKVCYRGVVP